MAVNRKCISRVLLYVVRLERRFCIFRSMTPCSRKLYHKFMSGWRCFSGVWLEFSLSPLRLFFVIFDIWDGHKVTDCNKFVFLNTSFLRFTLIWTLNKHEAPCSPNLSGIRPVWSLKLGFCWKLWSLWPIFFILLFSVRYWEKFLTKKTIFLRVQRLLLKENNKFMYAKKLIPRNNITKSTWFFGNFPTAFSWP